MPLPHDCPGAEGWQALLAHALSPAQLEDFERHLEWCPGCQARLDQGEDSSDAFLSLAREAGDPTLSPTDPTLEQLLERLHERRDSDRTGPTEPADLYFLRPTSRPDLLGLLGDYEVQEVLGQGGMGVVLKAFEPALHRLVAIKVLASAVAGSATARRRFTREARAAAAVCHEHIVAVYAVHEADGLPYLVMQYVAGESLQDRLDRTGPLEITEIVRIGMQTASGLAAAHAQGLIHRDIKPANILLEGEVGPASRAGPAGAARLAAPTGEVGPASRAGPAGAARLVAPTGEVGPASRAGPAGAARLAAPTARVKITDFGLARMVDDVGLTQNGVVAGTPEYMAPEQARGETVDHRADLFSLGSVLYACCTGAPPFRGPSAVAVLRQVSDQEPTPLRALNPDVPAWLEALIARLLAKDPAERFQSAAEVASLLEGYLAHLRQPATVQAPDIPFPEPGSRKGDVKTSSRLRWLAGLLFLAALGLSTALFLLAQVAPEPTPRVTGAPAVAEPSARSRGWGGAAAVLGVLLLLIFGLWLLLRRRPRAGWLAGFLALALLLSLAGLFLLLPRPPRPAMVDVPVGQEFVAQVTEEGFHGQQYDKDGQPFRWTDGHAKLVIPIDPARPPQALRIRLWPFRPTHAQQAALQILVNQRELFREQVFREHWEKTFDLRGMDLGREVVLEIISDSFVPSEVQDGGPDTRTLGVQVKGVMLLARAEERKNVVGSVLGSQPVAEVKETGFYGQQYHMDGQPFRWTNGQARLVIPLDRRKPPRALRLQLLAWRPEQASPASLRIVVNRGEVFNDVVPREPWERTFDLSGIDLGEEMVLELVSDTFVPNEFDGGRDTRVLGVEVQGILLLPGS
jgi:serine/threonine protein kinase